MSHKGQEPIHSIEVLPSHVEFVEFVEPVKGWNGPTDNVIPKHSDFLNFPTWAIYSWLKYHPDVLEEVYEKVIKKREWSLETLIKERIYKRIKEEGSPIVDLVGWALEYVDWPGLVGALENEKEGNRHGSNVS